MDTYTSILRDFFLDCEALKIVYSRKTDEKKPAEVQVSTQFLPTIEISA